MRITVRRGGTAARIILPKPVLAKLGVKAGGDLSLTVEKGPVVPMAAKAHPRSGWAEGAKAIADCGDAGLVWPEFGNAGDDEIVW